MKKKGMIFFACVFLICICIAEICLGGGFYKNNIQDITTEKNHSIQDQKKTKITLSVPISKLSEKIYSSNGQRFAENEIIVYQTDTTSIYLYQAMLSNESDEDLYFLFNCSYHLPDDGTILIPYKVNDNKTYTDELDLASYDITDDASTYAETVHLRGRGPAEQFAFYVSADVCKKAIGTMNIDVLINQLTYGG